MLPNKGEPVLTSVNTTITLCPMIPPYDKNGNMPPGIHIASWDEFVTHFGTSTHRQRLIAGLEKALTVLKRAGCERIYVDGSFVTVKAVPNDYDVAWDTHNVDIALLLSMEPVFGEFDHFRAAQKAKFLGEFFPSSAREGGSGMTFLEFFQIDGSTGNAKGIIALDL